MSLDILKGGGCVSWTGRVEGEVETEMEFAVMLIRKDLVQVSPGECVMADKVIYWLTGGPYHNNHNLYR